MKVATNDLRSTHDVQSMALSVCLAMQPHGLWGIQPWMLCKEYGDSRREHNKGGKLMSLLLLLSLPSHLYWKDKTCKCYWLIWSCALPDRVVL